MKPLREELMVFLFFINKNGKVIHKFKMYNPIDIKNYKNICDCVNGWIDGYNYVRKGRDPSLHKTAVATLPYIKPRL
jgi:hypothetical protein